MLYDFRLQCKYFALYYNFIKVMENGTSSTSFTKQQIGEFNVSFRDGTYHA